MFVWNKSIGSSDWRATDTHVRKQGAKGAWGFKVTLGPQKIHLSRQKLED